MSQAEGIGVPMFNEAELINQLHAILKADRFTGQGELVSLLAEATRSMLTMDPALRPANRLGASGGLVFLRQADFYVIVPDLHARMDFFLRILKHRVRLGKSILQEMAEGRVQLVCVGDAFHSESRGRERWQQALGEYIDDYASHEAMDGEMRENLGLLEMIARVQVALPDSIIFLKGNHENIRNESGEGNHPFRKFVYEGEMVLHWMKRFTSEDLIEAVYRWEKALPLMAAGRDFLVSHCEPRRELRIDEVINAYLLPDVIEDLTWVDNGQAQPGSVASTIQNILGPGIRGRIFGGHRPVRGRYDLRQNGSYVQINTPANHVIALVKNMQHFNPRRHIIDIQQEDL